MKIHIELKKKRYILYAAIIALLGVVGANISILHTNADKITKHIEYKSFLTQLIAVFRVSITNKEGNGIFYQLMAAGLFILFLIVFSYKYTVREVISAAILSILYGFCMWIGTVFSHRESWDYFLRNKYVMLLNAFYILGNAIILFGILLLLCRVILRISETDNQTEHSLKRVFLTCVLVLFVLWLPYYISMWPATIHGDFLMQVLQLFHYPTMLQHQLTSDGVNVFYSNDHPFLHTQLVGLFIKFGIKINNKALGYGMYTFLQMTAYIGGISAIITTLYKFGANHRILKAALGAYALFPVFPLYAIMVGGDSFFALFFLWFMVGILWIFKTQGDVLKNIKFDIFFAVIVFLMSASKNQGIYIALVTLVFCVICLKKYRIKILVTMFVPIFIFQFAYTGLLFKAARVSTVGKQEALSVCFQQTARYIKYYKDEVTKEEKNAINKVLDYEKIGNNYNPELADPVKNTYKTSATSMDLNNYFFVWLKMGLKHPVEYIEAFIANTYAYYAPLLTTNRGLYLKLNSMKFYKKTRPWVKDTIPQTFINKNNCESPRRLKKIRKTVITFCKLTYHIPVINWLYNPGVITWLMFMAFFVFWTRKEYDSMITFIPLLLIFGICLLSPKNNNLRYIYPTCCMIPAMLAAAFGEKNPDL